MDGMVQQELELFVVAFSGEFREIHVGIEAANLEDQQRKPLLQEHPVHHHPGRPAVAVSEGMDVLQVVMDPPQFPKTTVLGSNAPEIVTVLSHQQSYILGFCCLEAGIALDPIVCAFVLACRPMEAEKHLPVEFLDVICRNVLIEMLKNVMHRLVEILDHLDILFRLIRIDVAQDEFPSLSWGDCAAFQLCGAGKELEDAVIEWIDQFRGYPQDMLLHGDERNLLQGGFLAVELEDMLE